jgi:hypothetical protein
VIFDIGEEIWEKQTKKRKPSITKKMNPTK